MKKFLIILAVAVVAVAGGAYYFLYGKGDVCKNVIPEDAKAVMVFDAKEAVKQMDFSISDIIDFLKQRGDDEKKVEGIDFLAPAYGFVSNDNYLCGVLALSDADAFEKSVTSDKVKVESQRGFKWLYTSDVLACFDSKKALLMLPVSKGESDGMRGKMVEWMNQGSHEVPLLSSALDNDGVVLMRTCLGAIPATYQSMFKSGNVDLNKIFLNVAFNIKEKAFQLSTKLESEDEEYNKLVSEWGNYNRPIQGKLLQTPYENPLVYAVFNMDGETIYNKLSQNPQTSTVLSMMNVYCNTGMMLQAIDGDVSVAIDEISDGPSKYYITAHVKNKDFMKGAEEWGDKLGFLGIQCHQVEGDNYMLTAKNLTNYLGVRDESLYFASDYDVAKNGGKFSSLKDGASLESQTEGKLFYLSLNIDKLGESPLLKSQLVSQDQVKEILGYLDRLNVSMDKNKNAVIELTTKQKIIDILKMNMKK